MPCQSQRARQGEESGKVALGGPTVYQAEGMACAEAQVASRKNWK